ncbi:hypothetical protein J7643_07395 [bacterium]|nr:hypothetical protein [bacterium]
MKPPGLRTAIALTLRQAGVLLHPPGASPYLALMLAVAGFEVGFNTPYTIAETLAVRTLMTDGPAAFFAALKAVPDPSRPALGTALLLAALCLLTFGGWLNTAHALARGEEPTPEGWQSGMARSGRALFWLGLTGTIALVLIGGLGAVSAALIKAASMGALGDGWRASVLPWGVTSAFIALLLVGVYALVFTFLAAVVAVGEPETRLLRLPARTWKLFKGASSDRFLPRMGGLLFAWFLLKTALQQAIIPFQPLTGRLGDVLSVGGALLSGLLMVGDGVIALIGIVLAAQLYQAAATQVEARNE